MSLLLDFRPDGKKFTLGSGEDITLKFIRNTPRGIVALINDKTRVLLWDDKQNPKHLNDTELDFKKRIRSLL